jgi:hypothetical protein
VRSNADGRKLESFVLIVKVRRDEASGCVCPVPTPLIIASRNAYLVIWFEKVNSRPAFCNLKGVRRKA